MERTDVTSSWIVSVGYDEARGILEVEFASKAIYRYRGVPPEVYGAFMGAESKGRFLNRNIRDEYPYARIR